MLASSRMTGFAVYCTISVSTKRRAHNVRPYGLYKAKCIGNMHNMRFQSDIAPSDWKGAFGVVGLPGKSWEGLAE